MTIKDIIYYANKTVYDINSSEFEKFEKVQLIADLTITAIAVAGIFLVSTVLYYAQFLVF